MLSTPDAHLSLCESPSKHRNQNTYRIGTRSSPFASRCRSFEAQHASTAQTVRAALVLERSCMTSHGAGGRPSVDGVSQRITRPNGPTPPISTAASRSRRVRNAFVCAPVSGRVLWVPRPSSRAAPRRYPRYETQLSPVHWRYGCEVGGARKRAAHKRQPRAERWRAESKNRISCSRADIQGTGLHLLPRP